MNQTTSRLVVEKPKSTPMFYAGVISLIVMFALQCSGVNNAYALDGDAENQCTGPNSENENKVDQNLNISFSVTNNGSANNNLNVDLNTGNNDIGNNTSVGDITTGDILLSSSQTNVINSDPAIAIPDLTDFEDVNINGFNGTTGPNSTNNNSINNDVDFAFNIENNAEVDNDYNLELNTGNNNIMNNTLVGDIETGNILAFIRLSNYLNSEVPCPILPPVVPSVVPPPYVPSVVPETPMYNIELPTIERALGAAPTEFASIPTEFFQAGSSLFNLLMGLLLSMYISSSVIKKLRKVNA